MVKVDVAAMTELEFAKHRARLKAQIMKDMVNDEKEGDRVSYVRLPGTSQVAEVAFYDGEDQIMERNLNAVDSKKVIDNGIFRCMVQPVILRKKIKFLMDTGCGHDLISQKKRLLWRALNHDADVRDWLPRFFEGRSLSPSHGFHELRC